MKIAGSVSTILIIIIHFFFSTILFAQDNKMLGKVNITSPNAASLGKYGDIPVSYHTGVPNIAIPIYTVSSGSVQMPISLNYHASGIKTADLASWVGTGWALQAGGVITRSIRDKPDEKKTTSLSQTYGYYSDYGVASYDQNVSGAAAESAIDREPDIFSFNFNGYSGKFSFTDDRTPLLIPLQDIRIESKYVDEQWTNSPGAWNGYWKCIESFVITTPDGVKYFFGVPEEPVTAPYCDPIEVSSSATSGNGVAFGQVITSWYLYKIVSPDGNFQINLKYERDKYAFLSYTDNSFSALNVVEGQSSTPTYYPPSLIPVKTLVAGVRLSSIEGGNDVIQFIKGPSRQDLSRWSDNSDLNVLSDIPNLSSVALGAIFIKNKDSLCYKKFLFNYDYFTDNLSPDLSFIPGASTDRKRLKLLSVQESSCDGLITQTPYTFNYFSETVTRRLSFGTDHWGYQNGVTTNQGLYPQLTDGRGSVNAAKGLAVANRDPMWPAMRAGTLQQINYPTGGNSSFEFEPHLFMVVQQQSPIQTDKIVGGLRIKKIINHIPETNQFIETNYTYTSASSNYSSGVLYGKPTYIMLLRNDMFRKTRIEAYNNVYSSWALGCPSAEPFAHQPAYRDFLVSSSSLLPMEATQGYHIGYQEVKVAQQGNGYSIYRYHATPLREVKRDGIAITHVNNPSVCDTAIPNYPAAPLADDFKRGELIYEGHYKETGNLILEKMYQTEFYQLPLTIPGYLVFEYSQAARCVTPYEITTARKVKQTITEKKYDVNGLFVENTTESFMESPYHRQVTRTRSMDAKKEIRESLNKFSFDFVSDDFKPLDSCLQSIASYINDLETTYRNLFRPQYLQCLTSENPAGCVVNVTTNFYQSLNAARRALIGCRIQHFSGTGNSGSVRHDAFKSTAVEPLKTILWMQDNHMNLPIEQTVWKNASLTNAVFNEYGNKRDDANGIYLKKQDHLLVAQPLTNFNNAVIIGNALAKDVRYQTEQQVSFLQGNLIHNVDKTGISTSYEWGYRNQYPIVKIANAANLQQEVLVQGPVTKIDRFQLGNGTTNYSKTVSFKQERLGSIAISLPLSMPPNAQATLYYTLSGPVNQTGQLCVNGFGGASCSIPRSVNFSDMPVGQYTFTYTVASAFNSFTFNYSVDYTYEGKYVTIEGEKDFFYESFETGNSVNIHISNAKTGSRSYNGDYWIPYSIPNQRDYELTWWNYENGAWKFNKQPYSGPITISGWIDEVRVHPKDAQMTTYTYDPVVGMTSQCDPNNRITYYEYDAFGRLKLIRDQDRNIIKTFQYNYKQ
jgi:YD repeat-containing protein